MSAWIEFCRSGNIILCCKVLFILLTTDGGRVSLSSFHGVANYCCADHCGWEWFAFYVVEDVTGTIDLGSENLA